MGAAENGLTAGLLGIALLGLTWVSWLWTLR
jgi:hypothetical protein